MRILNCLRNIRAALLASLVMVMSVLSWSILVAADDEADAKIRDIVKATKKATTGAELISSSKELADVVDSAVQADDYPTAIRAATVALDLVTKANRKYLAFTSKQRKDDVLGMSKEFKALSKFTKKLETAPDDAEANRKVGLFTALIKEDWKRGSELLEKSGVPLLSKIGADEVKASEEADEQLSLGKAWAEAAEDQTGLLRSKMQKRSSHWFRTVLRSGRGDLRSSADEAFAELPSRYLSDMEELEKGQGLWKLGTYGDTGNDTRITVDGLNYEYGLGMHPDSRSMFQVKYKLNRKYKTFTGGCALNDFERGFDSEIRFSVFGDGRLLWKSSAFKLRNGADFFSVSVKDVQALEIRTECPGLAAGGHAVWLDPFVAK